MCVGCAPPIIPPGGISCQRKFFRSAICILDFICKIVSRTSFVSKNHFQTHAAGVSINNFRFKQGTPRILILVFPQDSILTSTYLLELGAIGLEPIIYYQSSTNAANLLWARLDKSIKLDYNIKKTDFLSDTTSLK